MKNLHHMTQREIEDIIYRNAKGSKMVGLRDCLTDIEILSLPDHPAWDYFDEYFKSWIWDTIDYICFSEEVVG